MQQGFFYFLGQLNYKLRWLTFFIWLIIIALCIPFIPQFLTPFKDIGFIDPTSQSAIANDYMNKKLSYNTNSIIVIYETKNKDINILKQLTQIKASLDKLNHLPIKHTIIYPDSSHQVSKDKAAAYAVILLQETSNHKNKIVNEVKSLLKAPNGLSMRLGGMPIFLEDTKTQTQKDLYRAEYIATPVAIITLLCVFGTVTAAGLTVMIGGVVALVTFMLLFIIGSYLSLSVFTLNLALLLALILSLDYALFIVSRFRDELKKNNDVASAIAVTQATAGKAVFFSGLAVLASLSALLLFQVKILYSVGIGGLTAVLISMLASMTLLPSLLSILKHKINALRIPWFNPEKSKSYWAWLATTIVEHPKIYFVLIVLLLAALSYPLRYIIPGNSDFRILPKTMQSRQAFDTFETKFGQNKLYPIYAVITSKDNNILSAKNIAALYDFAQQLKRNKYIASISSIVNIEDSYKSEQYQMLYAQDEKNYPQNIKDLIKITTKKNVTVMTIVSRFAIDTKESDMLINKLERMKLKNGLQLQLTGNYVNSIDVLNSIKKTFPYALAFIVIFSYLILLFLLRSIFLPIKAIVMNALSLCASYGVLVYVFQLGHFHKLLHFHPQGIIDISLLVIIFCALFGISMDYEVFLLTRIKECYEQSGDNKKSIVFGIVSSSRIITSAAIIVILISISFMTADVIIVKAVGLGIAAAVFMDAFIIRTMFVPATMALMAKWNWYLPRWLDRILPNISFDVKPADEIPKLE